MRVSLCIQLSLACDWLLFRAWQSHSFHWLEENYLLFTCISHLHALNHAPWNESGVYLTWWQPNWAACRMHVWFCQNKDINRSVYLSHGSNFENYPLPLLNADDLETNFACRFKMAEMKGVYVFFTFLLNFRNCSWSFI